MKLDVNLLRPKKVALFLEIGWVKFFSEYIFLIFNRKAKTQNKKTKKTKETKEEKRISVENVTGYNDIVCKCTFNSVNRVVNFSWLVI